MPDNDQSAGAMPAAGGATPPQSPPASPAADPPTTPAAPATGDPDVLGDAGKRALRAEREQRAAAERERDELKTRLEQLEGASKTEQQKALDEAVKAAKAETQASADARIRRAEVKAALAASGIVASELDLAAIAPEFGKLKVTDQGDVEGLAEAVKDFKEAHPTLFAKPGPQPGSADGGARGPGKTITREQLKAMSPEEINAAFDRGELAGLLTPGR